MKQPFKGGLNLRVIFALLAFWAAALSTFAQPGGIPAGIGGEFPKVMQSTEPGFRMGVEESDAGMYSTDVTGGPVINPYVDRRDAFSKVKFQGREYARVGQSTSMMFNTGLALRPLFGPTDNVRRFRGGPPTNAIIEAGPLYVQLNDVTAALLVSDNVDFTPDNEHWGAIAELRLRLSGILQISPSWRLVVAGSIIYLPFNNQFGVEGFGIGDAFGFVAEETLHPVTHMQLAYNSQWAEWNVQAVDDFTVNYLVVGGEFDYFARGDMQPEGIHASDRAGRYVFENGTTIPNSGVSDRQNDRLDSRVYLQLQNVVAGSASRMLPTETLMEFGASHSDYWFEGNTTAGTNGLGFSNYSEDRVFASLRNVRESMRFKPYAFYDAYRYNYDPDWIQQAGAGVAGPITDYTEFRAEGGYAWGGALQKDTAFYNFELIQTPTPYTWHMVRYSRVITGPVLEIRDTYRYGIHQQLGLHMYGRMYLQRSVYQPEQSGVFGSVEDRAASRIVYEPTRQHKLIIGGTYAESRFANPSRDRQTEWEARAELLYQYTPRLRFSFIYRYLALDVKQSNAFRDTDENLWILSAQKFF